MRIAIAFVVLVSANTSVAQTDAELWASASLQYKLSKSLKLKFRQHLRLQDNMSELKSVMPELSIAVKFEKNFKLAAGYRYVYKRTGSGDFDTRHRLQADGLAFHAWGQFKLQYRVRLQSLFKEDETKTVLRNRLKGQFGLSDKWEGAVAIEIFHLLDQGLETLRLTVGAEREVGNHEWEVFYRYETALDDNDEQLHILGVGVLFDL